MAFKAMSKIIVYKNKQGFNLGYQIQCTRLSALKFGQPSLFSEPSMHTTHKWNMFLCQLNGDTSTRFQTPKTYFICSQAN